MNMRLFNFMQIKVFSICYCSTFSNHSRIFNNEQCTCIVIFKAEEILWIPQLWLNLIISRLLLENISSCILQWCEIFHVNFIAILFPWQLVTVYNIQNLNYLISICTKGNECFPLELWHFSTPPSTSQCHPPPPNNTHTTTTVPPNHKLQMTNIQQSKMKYRLNQWNYRKYCQTDDL